MQLTRICLISLAGVGSAVACGVLANVTMDLVSASRGHSAIEAIAAPAQPARKVEAEAPAAPAGFALASATSAPADLTPVKVKTVPIVYREPPQVAAPVRAAAIPLPRPRPASAPVMTSLARQPAAMAIASATRGANVDENDPLSPAHIDQMKMALALTAEQEEFWPAVAAELRTIAKQMPRKSAQRGQPVKANLDSETIQRLYWAAAPLLTRLSYDQKAAVKEMARGMGLTEVAEAL